MKKQRKTIVRPQSMGEYKAEFQRVLIARNVQPADSPGLPPAEWPLQELEFTGKQARIFAEGVAFAIGEIVNRSDSLVDRLGRDFPADSQEPNQLQCAHNELDLLFESCSRFLARIVRNG